MPPCPSLAYFYLLFLHLLVPDFSGHRLVQDCQCLLFSCYITLACPLTLLIPPLPFADFCLRRDHFGSAFLDLSFFSSSCALWWWCVLFFPCLWLLLLCFSCCFGSVFDLSFLSPSSYPLPALCSPRVLCLVFLAVDWSRISSATLTSPLCLSAALFSFCSSSLSLLLCKKCPSVVLLAADWSGYHSTGSPQPFQSGTVSGRRLVQGCCFPYRFMELLDSKQRKPGSN